jgi:cytochrome P450
VISRLTLLLQYYEKVYKIKATEGVQVLIPPKFLGELKSLPEDTLSATQAVQEVGASSSSDMIDVLLTSDKQAMLSKYTGFCPGHNGELLSNLLRTKLSQNLSRLAPQLKGELEHLIATELPDCEDWSPIKVHPFTLRSIARMTGYAFVGPTLNRNEEWMDTSINYAVHVFLSAVKLQFFPDWMRPVAKYLVPDLGRIDRGISRAQNMLGPIIEERLRDMDCPGYENDKPDDFIQWLLDSLSAEDKVNIKTQTELQLILSAAAIHTTTNLTAECLFELASRPDVQELLREEVIEVFETGQASWGDKQSMAKLRKMDSFIKEVQRLSGNVSKSYTTHIKSSR